MFDIIFIELYYFISLISGKLPESIVEDNNVKVLINTREENQFYLDCSRLITLFFLCLDSFYSVTWLNNTQENLIHKEIDNFKYTLVDLLSIYSKYGYKIKTFFLSLFAEKINHNKCL